VAANTSSAPSPIAASARASVRPAFSIRAIIGG
jgi:hypothetical protein